MPNQLRIDLKNVKGLIIEYLLFFMFEEQLASCYNANQKGWLHQTRNNK